MTECYRIFRHFYFRTTANRDASDESNFIDEKDKWWLAYYRRTNVKCRHCEVFFPQA